MSDCGRGIIARLLIVLSLGLGTLCATNPAFSADSTSIGPLDPVAVGADYILWRKDYITLNSNNTPSQFTIPSRCVNSKPYIFCSVNQTQYEDPMYSACAILDYHISPSVLPLNTSEYLVRINGYVHTPSGCSNRNLTISCFVMCSVSSAS